MVRVFVKICLGASVAGVGMAAGMVGAQNLRELFENRVYAIDYYQREYSWPESDVRQLIIDLWNEFTRTWNPTAGRRRLLEAEPYFLGAFVYHEETDRTRFLVDGQQRFTTLHLMFVILHRLAVEYGEGTTARALNALIEYHPPGAGAQFRIRIHADEREPLLRAVYENNRRYRLPGNASLSLRHLWDCGQQLDALLRDRLYDATLRPFVDWLRDRVVMAPIRAVSRAHGFKIFETMNDRGARLTSVDLVKSFLLSSAGDRQDELNDAWRRMLNQLGSARQEPDVPRRFLRDVLVAQHAYLDGGVLHEVEEIDRNLNAWVRDNTDRLRLKNEDDYAAFINNLTAMARHYQTFLSAAGTPRAENKLESIYYNAVNGLDCQYTVLLAAVRPHDHPDSVRAKARLLASYIDRRYVLRSIAGDHVDDQHLFAELSDLMPRLRDCADVAEVAQTLREATAEEDRPFADLEAFAFRRSNTDQVRYLLSRLISYVEDQTERTHDICQYLEGNERVPRWQIEHLWPTTFDPSTQELKAPHFAKLRNQIGALVLLPASDNASLSDMPYGEKINRYSRQPSLVAILNPDHRKNNTPLRRFVESHGLQKTFRSFGSDPKIVEMVRERCALYTALSERIWDPTALGFGHKPASTPDVPQRAAEAEPEPPRKPAARRPAKAPGGRTVLAKMVRAGVIQAGETLFTSHNGTEHRATVTSRGLIELFAGVTCSSPDTALREITDRPTGNGKGMDLWQAEFAGERISLNDLRAKVEKNGVKLR